jgi:hypothetical protein
MGTKVTAEIEFEETHKSWAFTDVRDMLHCAAEEVFPASAKITNWKDETDDSDETDCNDQGGVRGLEGD